MSKSHLWVICISYIIGFVVTVALFYLVGTFSNQPIQLVPILFAGIWHPLALTCLLTFLWNKDG